jgi:hypothetical protein
MDQTDLSMTLAEKVVSLVLAAAIVVIAVALLITSSHRRAEFKGTIHARQQQHLSASQDYTRPGTVQLPFRGNAGSRV